MRFTTAKTQISAYSMLLTVALSASAWAGTDPDDLQKMYCPTSTVVTTTSNPTTTSTCPDAGSMQNILIVVDTSHRMDKTLSGGDPDINNKSRLELVKDAVHDLLDKLECANVGLMRTHTFGGPILYPVAPLTAPSIWNESTGEGYDNKDAGYVTDPAPTQACKKGVCAARDNGPDSTNKKLVRDRLHELVDQLGTMVNAPFTSTFYEAIEYFRGGRVLYGLGRGPNYEGDGGLGSATGGVDEKSDWTKKVPVVMRRVGRGGNDTSNNDNFMWPRAGITQDARKKSHVSHPASYTGGARHVPSGCNGWYDTSNNACEKENVFTYSGSIPTYATPVKNQNQMNNIVFLSQGMPDFDDMRWPLFSDKLTRNDSRDCSGRESSGNRIQSDARNNTYRPNNGGGNPDKKYCTYQKKSIVSANRMAYQDGWMRHWHHQFWSFDPVGSDGTDQGGTWFPPNRNDGNYWGFAWLDMNTMPYNWDENWWPWGSPPPGAPSEDSVHNKGLITGGQDWSKKDVVDRMFSVREERPEGQACRDFNNEQLQFVKWTACSIDQAEWAYNKGINEGGYTTFDGKKPWGLKKLRVFPVSYSSEKVTFPDDAKVGTQWRWRVNPDNRSGIFDPTDYLRHFAWRANSGGDFGKQIFRANNYNELLKAFTEKGTDSGNNSALEQFNTPKVTVTVSEGNTSVQLVTDPPAYAALGTSINSGDRFKNDERILLSFFEPSSKLNWRGNVKLYSYINGKIVDRDQKSLMKEGDSSLQSAQDFYNAETKSGWDPVGASIANDGQKFLENGLGGRLHNSTNGNVVTRKLVYNSGSSGTLADISASLLDAELSLSDDGTKLFNWIKGVDSYDEDGDSNLTEARWPVGAVLNSAPVALRYNNNYAANTDVAFVGTSAAVLHAFDLANGNEKFAFLPKEMWSYAKTVAENPSVVAAATVTANSGNGIGGMVGGTGAGTFTKVKTSVDFRGTPNSWSQTPMKLVANSTWATVQTFTSGQEQPPRFKVFADGTWQPDPDKATGGTGTFWVKYIDTASGVSAADVSFGQAYPNAGNTFYGRRSSVSFRGTPNGWGSTAMTLVDNFMWETYQYFEANGQFKFYTNNEWVGENGATANGTANISVTAGAGTYRIRFNDLTYQYTMMLGTYKDVKVANAGDAASGESMKMVAPNVWELSKTYSAPASIQFYIPETATWLGGPTPATVNGAAISIPTAGTYVIRFTDTTKAYVIGGQNSYSASGGLDGPLTVWVAEANATRNGQVDGSENAYVYATQRRGGNNMYALNVTNPASPSLAWKLSSSTSGFANLGQTWSSPTPAQMKIGGVVTDVMVFGGGYDELQDTLATNTDTAGHAIYIVNATTGAPVHTFASTSGTDQTAVVGGLNYSIPADVSVYDYNRDGLIDYLFAVDMGGRVIRVDFKSDTSGNTVVKAAGVIAELGSTSAGADRRRFFNRPDVALIQNPANKAVLLGVSIGSGHRGRPTETTTSDMMFTLIEDLYINTASPPFGQSGHTPVSKANLIDLTNPSAPASPTGGNDIGLRGIYLDLPGSGEKVLSRSIMVNHQVIFTTYTPESGTCNAQTGKIGNGNVYVVDLWQKGIYDNGYKRWRSDELATKGIPPAPRAIFQSDVALKDANGNLTGARSNTNPVMTVGGKTLTGVDGTSIDFGSLVEKITWEQRVEE
jgi:hypothetical protein